MNKTDKNIAARIVEGSGSASPIIGLTKRELFAAMAMQGMLADGQDWSAVPHDAVQTADRLIAALTPEKGD
jgi:hypothetical protein